MCSVRNIIFLTLGIYFFSTQLQMISGGCCGGSSTPNENTSDLTIPLLKDQDIHSDDIQEEGSSTPPILEDQDIDLGNILKEKNPIKYYKYAMIVYCRAVESKMAISRENISYLKELHKFNDSKPKRKSFDTTKYANLINTALQLLNEYHAAILELKEMNGLSYIQTAFYYRALQWLKYKMKIEKNENNSDYRRLAEAVKNNLQSDVAKNYLQDIFLPHHFQARVKYCNQDAQTISDLLNIGEYEDHAVDLFLKIQYEGFEAAELVSGPYIKLIVYETILENAIPENFKKQFNLETYEMLMYADYVYNKKNPRNVFIEDLNISDISEGNATGWKYALLCFYRNVQRYFPEHVKVDETNIKLLKNLIPSTHWGYELRLQSFASLYEKIIPEIVKQMEEIDYSTPELQINRVYYDRILAWFIHEISKEKYKSSAYHISEFTIDTKKNKIYDSLQDINSNLKKIIQREEKENYIIQLFWLDLTENIDTLETLGDLKNMGQDERQVLTLFFDFANFKDFVVEITNVPEWKLSWDPKDEKIYEKMLQNTNPEDFTKIFGMEPFQMLMRMDYVLHSHNHGINEFQEDYLRRLDVQYITEGTLSRWKYAMIFFYQAVEINLLENETIDSINTKLLVHLLDADTSQNLRLSCVAFLCVHILAEIDQRIQDKGVHLGGNPAQETYHEAIFGLIYPESTANGFKKWPSKEKRDLGIDETFRDILNKIRALRVDAEENSGSTTIFFDDLVEDLKQQIRSQLSGFILII